MSSPPSQIATSPSTSMGAMAFTSSMGSSTFLGLVTDESANNRHCDIIDTGPYATLPARRTLPTTQALVALVNIDSFCIREESMLTRATRACVVGSVRLAGSVAYGPVSIMSQCRLLADSSVTKPKKVDEPIELVNAIAPIEVDGDVAICDGGDDIALGHPREFIQLNRRVAGTPETCKYCGLRYVQKKASLSLGPEIQRTKK
eukprot:TRINITY_DN3818_c0_g1_i1.p1 TRINITY_DN3818_c0_g1~~TRINITY_DN3818_c0_g1_i1.p1  ORF type:complete len:203 (-),score=32.85 TRINITY_DN3818_c0_g1_i1:55-663(-)